MGKYAFPFFYSHHLDIGTIQLFNWHINHELEKNLSKNRQFLLFLATYFANTVTVFALFLKTFAKQLFPHLLG